MKTLQPEIQSTTNENTTPIQSTTNENTVNLESVLDNVESGLNLGNTEIPDSDNEMSYKVVEEGEIPLLNASFKPELLTQSNTEILHFDNETNCEVVEEGEIPSVNASFKPKLLTQGNAKIFYANNGLPKLLTQGNAKILYVNNGLPKLLTQGNTEILDVDIKKIRYKIGNNQTENKIPETKIRNKTQFNNKNQSKNYCNLMDMLSYCCGGNNIRS